jgi:hypothetical protein
MRKTQMFHKPHFKGDDFPTPRALTVTGVREIEVFIPNANAKEHRWVVDVREDPRYIFLSETLFDNIASSVGNEDTDNWAGQAVQFYRVQVHVRGEARWGVRARKALHPPASGQALAQPSEPKSQAAKPERKLPAPITDTTPTRPYPPQTLLKGFAAQLKGKPDAWKAAAMPKNMRARVCIGFKAMLPDFSVAEVGEARHALCGYLCDGRERLSSDADNYLTWADGMVLVKWLFTDETDEDGHRIPCKLAAVEAEAILSFVGFFDSAEPEQEAEEEAEDGPE